MPDRMLRVVVNGAWSVAGLLLLAAIIWGGISWYRQGRPHGSHRWQAERDGDRREAERPASRDVGETAKPQAKEGADRLAAEIDEQPRRREFDRLPAQTRQQIEMARQAARTMTLEEIAAQNRTHLAPHFYRQHLDFIPELSADDVRAMALLYAKRRGVEKHLANLKITDPAVAERVRVSFGLLTESDTTKVLRVSEQVAQVGYAKLTDAEKGVVRAYPDLFPA